MDCETVQHLVEVFNLFNYPWNVIYWTIPVLSLMDIARNAEAVKFQIRSVYTHSPALRIGSSVYRHFVYYLFDLKRLDLSQTDILFFIIELTCWDFWVMFWSAIKA